MNNNPGGIRWQDGSSAFNQVIKEGNKMSKAERLLVIGTFGICTGVWITLAYLVYVNTL